MSSRVKQRLMYNAVITLLTYHEQFLSHSCKVGLKLRVFVCTQNKTRILCINLDISILLLMPV